MPFSAQTRMSGCTLDGHEYRKGAVDAVVQWVRAQGGAVPADLLVAAERIGDSGGTPLAVAENAKILGIVHLKDIVKLGIAERLARFRAMGIRTVMITGDNPRTAATIAREAGVDDFLAEATPERKMELIREQQQLGRLVAMTGDGTNDAPALAQADVGMAMNTGTQAAKEAANMIDLDSDPDQAPRGGGDRQAAPDDAGLAHHVLDRERRGQVLRDPAGDVHGRVPGDRAAQRHGPDLAALAPSSRR